MFCQQCGNEVPENGVCPCAQTVQPAAQQAPQQPAYQQPQQAPQQPAYQQPQGPPVQSDNRKIYSILSYIGILWLFGMCAAPEKNDPGVRFHVGQGLLVSILMFGFSLIDIVLGVVLRAVFTTTEYNWLWGEYTKVNPAAGIISSLLWLITLGPCIALAVLGILNAVNGRQKPLPVIGNFAFYK